MSSFGPSQQTTAAENNLQSISPIALQNSQNEMTAGSGLLNQGAATLAPATNWFQTLLNGNKANTTELLQPNIDQIKQSQQGQLQSAATLAPRGGGRSSTLFSLPFQANSSIQNLFGGARATAAPALAQIGQGQEQLGSNLFSTANAPLNTAVGSNQALADIAQKQQQMQQQFWSSLGSGIFGLATTPFGGAGKSLLGRI